MTRKNQITFSPLEISIAVGILSAFSVVTLLDILNDAGKGLEYVHLSFEVVMFLLSLSCAVWAGRQIVLSRRQTELERKEKFRLEEEYRASRKQAEAYLAGAGEIIEKYCLDWQLSTSEKDVALLILKGFSYKEIADLRDVSERTVRQQAGAVLKKAGVGGRSELAAFFLEEFLAPVKP